MPHLILESCELADIVILEWSAVREICPDRICRYTGLLIYEVFQAVKPVSTLDVSTWLHGLQCRSAASLCENLLSRFAPRLLGVYAQLRIALQPHQPSLSETWRLEHAPFQIPQRNVRLYNDPILCST